MKIIKFILICSLLALAWNVNADDKSGQWGRHSGDHPKEPVCKLVNNGKILSRYGLKNISDTEIASIMVSPDTVFITVKDNELKRLEKDSRNYLTPACKSNKKSKKHSK